jgi:hypothetical protein
MTSPQYEVRHLRAQVKAFKSGEEQKSLEGYYEDCLAAKDREIRKLKLELGEIRTQYIDVRNNWQDVIEDIEAEHAKTYARQERSNKALWRRIEKFEKENTELRQRLQAEKEQKYTALIELEEEKSKVKKLKAQIKRDYETSGIPSSMVANKKKITNNREKTGRRPGGQPGHMGHRRKQYKPTITHEIYPNLHTNPCYRPTGRRITKQLVDVQVNLIVTEWRTDEYRDIFTGQRVHAAFPDGLVNEVTYGGTVKALAFLVQNHCNVSMGKTSDLLCEITGGQRRRST